MDQAIIYEYDNSNKPIRGIHAKVPNSFDYSDQTSIERALYFLVIARNQNYLIYKVAYYMPIFECLFIAQGVTEITYKMALRVAFYIGKDEKEREDIFDKVKRGYDIRSRFLHGQELEIKKTDRDSLLQLSTDIDNILRRVFIKIIEDDANVFIKYNSKERELFLNNLPFGLPFDHTAILGNIKLREDTKQKDAERFAKKKEKTVALNKKKSN